MIDLYTNASWRTWMLRLSNGWSRHDDTEMKQGVGERKYKLDSLCYSIRLAHGYWKRTGETQPFDAQWLDGMRVVVRTMREQQRKNGLGPYHFQRTKS